MIDIKRHHPLTMLWSLWKLVKNSFAIILFLFVFRQDSESQWLFYGRIAFYVGISIGLISIIWKWFTSRYTADDTAFHIYSGVFNRTRRTIPYAKVQNVNRHTTVFHRLFRVTSMRFETGIKGEDATFQLHVVSISEAELLEKIVAGYIAEEAETVEAATEEHDTLHVADPIEEGESQFEPVIPDKAMSLPAKEKQERVVHYHSTRKDIFKASFTSLSFLVLIPVLATLYSWVKDFFPDEEVTESLLLTWLDSWWIASLMILVLLIISIALGIVRTFVKYGNFQITSDAKRIYISKGMMEQTSFSILKERVQAVKITQSPMKRLLGLAEVELTTAGSLGESEHEVNSLYPFLPVKQAYSMIEEILPSYRVTQEMEKLPQISLWLRMLKPSWGWIVITGLLWYFKPFVLGQKHAWWMISAILLVWIVTCRVVEFFHTRYILNQNFIQLRTGALTSTLFISKREKVIEVQITRNVLQRWLGVASIYTVNRAKPVLHHRAHDIPLDMAESFQSWYMGRTQDVQTR
ncbi:PH domain-containing protein [Paenibacillus amylolyticus]|uniref:Membrane-flanked domain-containing protein n=1 Tax=Paenibacillus amylolyticus TaxID=1451 RepID=A0A100VII3_PAEAM|nr:PH domain-containing protein [Paenibacillus amylolyticus]GAS80458.1 membrane-flanked domain-containing protein [Paenibacillus amylolyticus]